MQLKIVFKGGNEFFFLWKVIGLTHLVLLHIKPRCTSRKFAWHQWAELDISNTVLCLMSSSSPWSRADLLKTTWTWRQAIPDDLAQYEVPPWNVFGTTPKLISQLEISLFMSDTDTRLEELCCFEITGNRETLALVFSCHSSVIFNDPKSSTKQIASHASLVSLSKGRTLLL